MAQLSVFCGRQSAQILGGEALQAPRMERLHLGILPYSTRARLAEADTIRS